MSPGRHAGRPILLVAALLLPALALAQVPEVRPPPPPSEGSPFTLSLGPGGTASLTHPGDWTLTLTLAVGYAIDDRWTVTVAPYWEREFDHAGGVLLSYDELSISVGATYSFAPRWSVGMDLDFGLVHDFGGTWARNPEFGIGLGVSYAIPLGGPWALVIGPEISWKISDDEWQVGLNSGFGFDF